MHDDDFDEEATNIVSLPIEGISDDKNQAYFIVLAGTNVGEMYKLEGTDLVLGRGKGADIQLLDDGISREHCKVSALPTNDIMIQDLNSRNGTFANGKKIRSHILQDGDKIRIGSTTILKFTYNDNLEENFQRQMYEAALRDGLTKAFNKKYFKDRLISEVAYSQRHRTPLTLIMIDIDLFKHFNDTYGHLAGDHILEKLAQRVMSSIRTEDVFARYGGEEFAVIGRGIPLPNGAVLGERIRTLIASTPFSWNGKALAVTISLGVAGLPDPRIREPKDLVAAADSALYEAKEAGRNRVAIYGEITE